MSSSPTKIKIRSTTSSSQTSTSLKAALRRPSATSPPIPDPILFTKTSDGLYHCRFELRVYVYDQDGSLIIDSMSAS